MTIKDVIIEKIIKATRSVEETEPCGSRDVKQAHLSVEMLEDLLAIVRSNVVLTVADADALLNDDGNANENAIDNIEKQLTLLKASSQQSRRERKL